MNSTARGAISSWDSILLKSDGNMARILRYASVLSEKSEEEEEEEEHILAKPNDSGLSRLWKYSVCALCIYRALQIVSIVYLDT